MTGIFKTTLSAAALGFCGTAMLSVPVMAANSVKADQLNVERPTLISEGFDWRIDGDDNRNATVTVKYRKKGDSAWKEGLPFLRAVRTLENGGGGRPVLSGLSPFSPEIQGKNQKNWEIRALGPI